MLNRHSQIFAGPEANLFAFPQVYSDWEQAKQQLLTNLKNDAWQTRKGVNLLQPAFGWEQRPLEKMLRQSSDFPSFVHAFFDKPLQKDRKKIWVAKSPSNAVGLAPFLRYFPDGKVVQTIRNPYDTIASLMARGMNVYKATGYYVFNTAVATLDHPRYYHLKYENLVRQPNETLAALFSFFELPFEPQIVTAQYEKRVEPTKVAGWKHEETAAIQASSIGRFQELSAEQRALVRLCVSRFRISDHYLKKYQIRFATGKELCQYLGYDFLPADQPTASLPLKFYLWLDRLGRVKHGFSWQFFEYLAEV